VARGASRRAWHLPAACHLRDTSRAVARDRERALEQAEREIDVLAYAALWLWDTVPDFVDRIQLKLAQGVAVRICLGQPDCAAVRLRGQEEGIDDGLSARCRLAISYARPIEDAVPGTVRLTDATLYASIFRFDDEVLLNTHLYGSPASESPVLQCHHERVHGLAGAALRSFERVWLAAQPLEEGR